MTLQRYKRPVITSRSASEVQIDTGVPRRTEDDRGEARPWTTPKESASSVLSQVRNELCNVRPRLPHTLDGATSPKVVAHVVNRHNALHEELQTIRTLVPSSRHDGSAPLVEDVKAVLSRFVALENMNRVTQERAATLHRTMMEIARIAGSRGEPRIDRLRAIVRRVQDVCGQTEPVAAAQESLLEEATR